MVFSSTVIKKLAEMCLMFKGDPVDVRFNHGAKRNIYIDFVTFMDSFQPSEVTIFDKPDGKYVYVDRHNCHFYSYAEVDTVKTWMGDDTNV